MHIVLFEDASVSQLYPISVGRPAFAITCGGYRLVDHALAVSSKVSAVVRPHLRSPVRADFPDLVGRSGAKANEATLLVNARIVPSVDARREILRLTQSSAPGVLRDGETVVAARVGPETLLPPDHLDPGTLTKYLETLAGKPLEADLPLLDHPHDVLRYHLAVMRENTELRIREGSFREVGEGVFLAEDAALGAHVVTRTAGGPIVIDRGASVGPYSFLEGPAYLSPKARILEHAAIKDAVCLGHTTKIGGEVEASIIEPYTNKQHHGFLGHSYLGSWINLGAGTCNSDLKNTYGEVKMEYRHDKVATGMQFVGALIGDYAKTAINTGIFTGKTVGVCSMVYGFVTTNVPSFVNYARLFGQVTATPVEVMVSTQARMFARRNVPQRPCDIQLLHDMFDLTRHERELGSVPPEPLSL